MGQLFLRESLRSAWISKFALELGSNVQLPLYMSMVHVTSVPFGAVRKLYSPPSYINNVHWLCGVI